MANETIDQWLRREWRELGFYYDRNDQTRVWRFIGSRSGLLRFHDDLLEYADDQSNDYKSEHSHYGPYSYLKIMTWPEPSFEKDAIQGSLTDLRRLAAIVGNKLAMARLGDSIHIQDEFAENSPYGLILEVREDDFDPAQADPKLSKEAD